MKRLWLIAALLFMVGCTNDEATDDTRDLVDDADRGVEDMVDDTEKGTNDLIDDTEPNINDDNTAGDGTGPLMDSPNVNGSAGPANENEDVNEGRTNNGEQNNVNDTNKEDIVEEKRDRQDSDNIDQ